MRPRLLLSTGLAALVLTGCTTAPRTITPATTPAVGPVAPLPVPAVTTTIRGSEESSVMLDSSTVFITAVDHEPLAAGRAGWNTPLGLKAGRRKLAVEFRRGVFSARTVLEVDAQPDASYQLKFNSDTELFGKNSYCDFWVVDLATGKPVTGVVKAAVAKGE